METKKIKLLLDAFYAGNTTLEEEQTLMDYFCSEKDIPKEFETDKEIFCSLKIEKEKDIIAPKNLEKRLKNHIDNLARESQKESSTIKIDWKKIISIAAVVAILIGCSIYIHYSNQDSKVQISSRTQIISKVDTNNDVQDLNNNTKGESSILASNQPIKEDVASDTVTPKLVKKAPRTNKRQHISHPIRREGTEEDAEKALIEIARKLRQVDSKCSYAQNKINETNTEIYNKIDDKLNNIK